MSIESWLLPVLWREHDWPIALKRLRRELATAPQSASARRAAIELGLACEYIDPDRTRALAAYELAGATDRARDLAIELGAWGVLARISVALRAGAPHSELMVEEAAAWWDAGQPALCALALAGLRDADRTANAQALEALVEGHALEHHQRVAVLRATEGEDSDPVEDYTMAARLAIASGDDGTRWLEAAMLAAPGHSIAARLLLTLTLQGGDHDRIQRYLRLRLDGLDLPAWLDNARACALAMLGTERHRGFGMRLLRQALERAYAAPPQEVPGHLAMWSALAARAARDGIRRELLPLIVRAIEWSRDPIDHVWLGALATEIVLHDANDLVVASGYADIVAEHAPEHPVVRELIRRVNESAVVEPDVGLDALYESVAGVATFAADVDEIADDDWSRPMIQPASPAALLAAAGVSKPNPFSARSLANGTLPPRTMRAPTNPVLASLRTPDRPTLPPRPAPPVNAKDRARRIALPIDVRVRGDSGSVIEAHSRDISTSGLFVITDAALTIGDELDIELRLPGSDPLSERGYSARARVVRREDSGYGIELIAPHAELIGALAEL